LLRHGFLPSRESRGLRPLGKGSIRSFRIAGKARGLRDLSQAAPWFVSI
jgi:hypothetical protein